MSSHGEDYYLDRDDCDEINPDDVIDITITEPDQRNRNAPLFIDMKYPVRIGKSVISQLCIGQWLVSVRVVPPYPSTLNWVQALAIVTTEEAAKAAARLIDS